jgi:hypothetical protein
MSRLLPFALLVLPLIFPFPSGATGFQAGSLQEGYRVEVLASGPERTVLRFQVGQFDLSPVEIDGGEWSIVDWKGGAAGLERGLPSLPAFHESIVLPDDARMELRVLSAEFQDFQGVRIAPSKGLFTRDILPSDVPYEFSEFYNGNDWYPAELASLGAPYILRDVRGAVTSVNAFQWNPALETLRVYTRVDVEIRAAGPGEINVLTHRPDRRVREFEEIYARHFLNYGGGLRYSPVVEAGTVLVIAYDSFAPATQPLVDWKNEMGLPTRLALKSEVGTTANDFKAYIQDAYDNEGVCYIILVGDAAQIPYFLNDGGAADPMMTLLAGGDSYPDAFIGRISAETPSQVETQVERIVEYERDPDPAGTWYSKGIAIASNEGAGIGDDGEADWQHARNYRADLLAFTYTTVDELYDGSHGGDPTGNGGGGDAAGNPTPSMVADRVNAGRSFIGYTGHGSSSAWSTSGFSSANVNALVNDNQLPAIISVACVNGLFTSGTCFAEAWLRATHSGEPTGAVACYMSTVNQGWAPPMRAQDELVDLLCGEAMRTWGGLCFNGSCDMIDHYGSAGISEFKNWTIFGDPSLQMRTATPLPLAVSHSGTVDPAAGEFEVTTEPGALAALSDEGVLIGSAYADELGIALIMFDPQDMAGRSEVTLTVTAFNCVPNSSTVPVGTSTTSVPAVAGVVSLEQNLPNPFARSTRIAFSIAGDAAVRLEIYDVAGRRVRTLENGLLPAGIHDVTWDGTDDAGHRLAAGSYFYRLVTNERVETKRMVRLR